ncbi:MAG TPA: hypothetical protein ENI51_00970 [Candidatus Atribacteria bacterium]|nr:hypothetical protein [Candidatus Atribacteria bacterium]
MSIFWDPLSLLISFMPLTLLLIKFMPFKNFYIDLSFLENITINSRKIFIFISIFLLIFCVVGAFIFQDPGVEKQGRVLIDEFHSNWEDTTTPMNRTWYGMLSTYNYYNWAKFLDLYYDVNVNLDRPITNDLLKNFDILIIKCPTTNFSLKEIDNIINFVREGGGLLLIGDHSNVFGMNYYLNTISENFGIRFNYDTTYDLNSLGYSIYRNNRYPQHVILKNLDTIHFLTSCTLEAPFYAEPVILGYGLIAEPGTYSTPNFVRESSINTDTNFGIFLQSIALKYGKGRVVAFTDSTCFSNFCFYMDGYTTFNLGIMNYLNRTNTLDYTNILLFLGLGLSIPIFLLLKKEKKEKIILLFIIIGLFSTQSSLFLFSHLNQLNYSISEYAQQEDITNICFLQDKSSFIISPNTVAGSIHEKDHYNTFFVWTQRLGYYPSIEKNLHDSLNIGDALVIINPQYIFTDNELKQLLNFIREGGKLLLLGKLENIKSASAINQIINLFGARLNINNETHEVCIENLSSSNPYTNITTENISINQQSQLFIIVIENGNGKIIIAVDSTIFSDYTMGTVFSEPNTFQKKLYEIEYYLFNNVVFKS